MQIKKKTKWHVLILISQLTFVAFGQETFSFYSTLNSNNAIVIPAGEKWKLICYSSAYPGSGEAFAICTATNNFNTRVSSLYGTENKIYVGQGSFNGAGSVLVGPLYIYPVTSERYLITFEKVASGIATISSTGVVIPQSATGDVDVKMEQSADNVTWTECLPGTYNSSIVKRFFRLRAVEK